MFCLHFSKLKYDIIDIRIKIKKKYPSATVTRKFQKNKENKKEKILPKHLLNFSVCAKSRKIKKLTDVVEFD